MASDVKKNKVSDFPESDLDMFNISADKLEASNQIRKLCLKLFKTEILIKNDFLNNNNYNSFFQIKQVKSIFGSSDIIETVEIYFENGLNTSVASLAGYMHRNTMVYRLQKINKTIGLDVRNFNDAVLYKNIITCFNILFNKIQILS